jgi:LEA14-like dessication related protein
MHRPQPHRSLLLVGFLAAGCMPSVEPVGMDIDELDWETVQAHVDLRANNPWPIDLTVLEVQYDVRVGSEVVATGTIDTPQTVPARGKRTVALPVTVDTVATLQALSSTPDDISETATTGAVLSGTVTVDTPFGPTVLPIALGREVPVLAEPEVRKPWIEVDRVDFGRGTVDLVVGVTVTNPNPIALDVRGVDFGVSFSDARVVEARKQQVALAASDRSQLEFPVKLDVSAVGRGVMRAFETGRISGEVWLSGKVQTPWNPVDLDLRRAGRIQVWE